MTDEQREQFDALMQACQEAGTVIAAWAEQVLEAVADAGEQIAQALRPAFETVARAARAWWLSLPPYVRAWLRRRVAYGGLRVTGPPRALSRL